MKEETVNIILWIIVITLFVAFVLPSLPNDCYNCDFSAYP